MNISTRECIEKGKRERLERRESEREREREREVEREREGEREGESERERELERERERGRRKMVVFAFKSLSNASRCSSSSCPLGKGFLSSLLIHGNKKQKKICLGWKQAGRTYGTLFDWEDLPIGAMLAPFVNGKVRFNTNSKMASNKR